MYLLYKRSMAIFAYHVSVGENMHIHKRCYFIKTSPNNIDPLVSERYFVSIRMFFPRTLEKKKGNILSCSLIDIHSLYNNTIIQVLIFLGFFFSYLFGSINTKNLSCISFQYLLY